MSGFTAPQTRFSVAVEVEVVAVVDTKEATLTMTARRGMIGVAAVEEVDVVDIVAVVVEVVVDTRGIGRAITLMIIARGRLVRGMVWYGQDEDGMIRI